MGCGVATGERDCARREEGSLESVESQWIELSAGGSLGKNAGWMRGKRLPPSPVCHFCAPRAPSFRGRLVVQGTGPRPAP